MEYRTPEEWNAHYADGKDFRPLGDSERDLINRHLAPAPGATALDLGCGSGELARHLTAAGYRTVGADQARAALRRATDTTSGEGGAGGPEFVLLDAECDDWSALPRQRYDLITCRLAYAFIRDRDALRRRIAARLTPGGAWCVITPQARHVPAERRAIVLDDTELADLTDGWGQTEQYDADGLAVVILRHPTPTATAPRLAEKRPPNPHALTGVGITVVNPAGQVLLGWSVRDLYECPGGKLEPGESFEEAAVRELVEETGLRAEPADVRILSVLLDTSHGHSRLTAAAHITTAAGTPAVTEPHLIRHWDWWDPAHLPQPLFTPTAHVLAAWRPALFTHLPPAHTYPFQTPAAGRPPLPRPPAQATITLHHSTSPHTATAREEER